MKHLLSLIATVLLAMPGYSQSSATDSDNYMRNFSDTQVSDKASQKVTNIKIDCSKSGVSNVVPDQSGTNYVYRPMLSSFINVEAGEDIKVTVSYSSGWMNAYVYIDRDNNGQFDVDPALSQENPTPDCDLVSYSYIETEENTSGFNMSGETITGNNRNTLALPSFTLAPDMAQGLYRVRIKIDWGSADPAGRMTETNNIVTNGGQIVDFMINVHGQSGTLAQSGDNGEILDAERNSLTADSSIPFGKRLTVYQQPAEGYVPGEVVVRYGYNLDGEQYNDKGNPEWYEATMPSYATGDDGRLDIPQKYAVANMLLRSNFIAEGSIEKGDYPLNFDPETLMINSEWRAISALEISNGDDAGYTLNGWNTTKPFPVYADATEHKVTFAAGETLTITPTSKNTTWMYAYVYIDYDRDGYFTLSDTGLTELVTRTTKETNYNPIPSFTLPTWLPNGNYRVRFKTDWDCEDPGGRYGDKYTANFINDNCGQIIDFTLTINNDDQPFSLREETEHCNLFAADGTTSLRSSMRHIDELTFKVVPMEGYVLDGTIDVISGDVTTHFDTLPDDGLLTAPVSENTLIRAHFKEGPNATWHCIFNDEFNGDNYTWDDDKWIPRALAANVTWARFNSQLKTDSVCVQNNGYMSLSTRTTGTNTMVTGNLTTEGRCDFTYGRVEARCLVHPWTGNFPAFWMMPAHQKPNYSGTGTWGGWPHSGEIDIMEQINTDNKAHHTIHSHWANGANEGGLGQTYQKTTSEYVNMSVWHIYTLEWDKEQLRWYVDGNQVHCYDRISDKDNDEDRQWPFDQPFYVLINQSVGNGGWAAKPDFSHEYCMDVDYVRIYQVREPDAISEAIANASLNISAFGGRIVIKTPCETNVRVYNLYGVLVFDDIVNGTASVAVTPGVYVVGGRKIVVP